MIVSPTYCAIGKSASSLAIVKLVGSTTNGDECSRVELK